MAWAQVGDGVYTWVHTARRKSPIGPLKGCSVIREDSGLPTWSRLLMWQVMSVREEERQVGVVVKGFGAELTWVSTRK